MNDDLVMEVVGGGLIVLAVLTIWAHLRGWRGEREDASLDPVEFHYLRRRVRRRIQTSVLMASLGALVALHPVVIPAPKDAPRLFAVWWIAALLIAGWIILMALADMLSTRAHSQVTLSRLQLKQRQLHRELESLQRDPNGE